MKHQALDILLFIGGFLYFGFRGVVSKWVVLKLFKISKKYLIKTDRHVEVFAHFYFAGLIRKYLKLK